MLRALLGYFSAAVAVQLVTGFLTQVTVLVVLGGSLSARQLGEYFWFVTALELATAPFHIGLDQGLVRYVNAGESNYGRFLRFFLGYGLLLTGVFLVVALVGSGWLRFSTLTGLALVGPFVIAELGKLVFRAHLEKRIELSLQAFQSLAWSLGCTATVLLSTRPAGLEPEGEWLATEIPILWAAGATVVSAGIAWSILYLRARRLGGPAIGLGWRDPAFSSLRDDVRHLWIGGLAFIANVRIVQFVVETFLGTESLGQFGYAMTGMLFVFKPLTIIQRAALPLFTRLPEEVADAFRTLVRVNLLVFPAIALGVLFGYELVLDVPALSKYSESWPILAIICASTPMFAVEYLVATVATARGMARNTRQANVATFLINVPVVLALVWSLDLAGAALAAMLYPLIFGGLMLRYNARDLPEFVGFAARMILRSLFWLWVAVGFLISTEDGFWRYPVAFGVYLVGTLLSGLWRPGHFAQFLGVVRGR